MTNLTNCGLNVNNHHIPSDWTVEQADAFIRQTVANYFE
jgi:hypothetical protein